MVLAALGMLLRGFFVVSLKVSASQLRSLASAEGQ